MTAQGNNSDRVPLAIFTIVVTVLALAIGDSLIKKISTGFSLWQIFTLRSCLAVPVVMIAIKLTAPGLSFIPQEQMWTTVRSIMLTLMWVIYYIALPYVPLSIAAAGFYTLPLFITLFSAIVNRERITRGNLLALFLGFAGVILILQPRTADFNFYALLPIVSAVLYALSMIITRARCRSESPLVLSLSLNVAMICIGLTGSLVVANLPHSEVANPFVVGPWSEITVTSLSVILVLSCMILIGSVGTAFAYQNAPSSLVSVFDFCYVAFAAIMGFLLFKEIPNLAGWIGIGLIITAGIVIAKSGDSQSTPPSPSKNTKEN